MIGQMAIAIGLPGFNGLERSVPHTFLSRIRFCLQISPHCPKMNKKSMWDKKNQDFGPRDIESYHLAKRVKLWSATKCEIVLQGTTS